MSTLNSQASDEDQRGSPTVLVVEDEAQVRNALVDVLEKAEFKVFAADGLDAALSLFTDEAVDVVVSDLVMPGGDGLELLEHVELRDPTVPVVIVTGHQSIESASRAVRQGAFDYLVKPVESGPLVAVVSRAFDHGKEARRIAQERLELEEERAWFRSQNRQRMALLGLLFRELEEGVVVWDREGRVVDASESFLQLAGAKVVLNRAHIDELFSPHPSVGAASKVLERLYADRRGSWTGSLTLQGKRGPQDVVVTASLSASEVRPDSSDQVVALVRAPHRASVVGPEAAERLAHRGRLASAVAHEIRNDLGPILGYLGMLETSPQEQEMVDAIRSSIRSLEGRLEHLQSAREDDSVEGPVGLHQCFEQVISKLRRSGFARRVTIELPDSTSVVVGGHRQELEFLMTSLLVNAIDALAHNPAGTIRIRVTERDPQVLVAVEDNGEGMDERTAASAFETLFTTKPLGSGLGLPVAKRIVERHGGMITLDSKMGVGTTVTFSLPLYVP